MKVKINDTVIASSNATIVVEGNHYFPQESINKEYFKKSHTSTTCPWKGVASYYHVEIEGKEYSDIAWYYPEPSDLAANIKNYIAFWKDAKVVED